MLDLGGRSRYILLAEDNPADVQLVREALEDRAVQCGLHVVPDGAQAISFIEQVDRSSTLPCPSLLLLDLHLPKRNGEEILRYLRASERCGIGYSTIVMAKTTQAAARIYERRLGSTARKNAREEVVSSKASV